MTSHDELAMWVPLLATKELTPEERERAERHLAECEDCRRLHDYVRGVAADLPSIGVAGDHVPAQLLVEQVEERRPLPEGVAQRIEAHLARCDLCRSARAYAVASLGAEADFVDRSSLWERLTRTLLAPVPALAYAVLVLLLAVPLIWRSYPSDTPIAGLGRAIEVEHEARSRSSDGQRPEAVVVPVDGDGRPILLMLRHELPPEWRQAAGARLRIEVVRQGEVLWSGSRSGEDLDGSGAIPLLLHPSRLPLDAPLHVRIVDESPSPITGGQLLFRREVRWVR